MLRKIDRFIGRNMSAKRWMVFWLLAGICSAIGFCVLIPSWWAAAPLLAFGISSLMFDGNARRMK